MPECTSCHRPGLHLTTVLMEADIVLNLCPPCLNVCMAPVLSWSTKEDTE